MRHRCAEWLSGVLSGSIDIDVGFNDGLQGVWNDPAREIVFNRVMTRNDQAFIQNLYRLSAYDQGPHLPGSWCTRAGSDFPLADRLLRGDRHWFISDRARGGWVARQHI